MDNTAWAEDMRVVVFWYDGNTHHVNLVRVGMPPAPLSEMRVLLCPLADLPNPSADDVDILLVVPAPDLPVIPVSMMGERILLQYQGLRLEGTTTG